MITISFSISTDYSQELIAVYKYFLGILNRPVKKLKRIDSKPREASITPGITRRNVNERSRLPKCTIRHSFNAIPSNTSPAMNYIKLTIKPFSRLTIFWNLLKRLLEG